MIGGLVVFLLGWLFTMGGILFQDEGMTVMGVVPMFVGTMFIGIHATMVLHRSHILGEGPQSWQTRLLKIRLQKDEYGTLYTAPTGYGWMRFIKVQDSTGTFWLIVPPATRSAKAGVAWTYGMFPHEYHPTRV